MTVTVTSSVAFAYTTGTNAEGLNDGFQADDRTGGDGPRPIVRIGRDLAASRTWSSHSGGRPVAELVQGTGPVADLGCGHGHVTARLHALGLSVLGVDLSPRMVALARRAHPGLRFDQGSMTALNLPEAALGGIVALHSIIHIPQERLPEVFAEFSRVLAPGGHVLLSFQVGDERVRRTEAFGHAISLDHYLRSPDRVAEFLGGAGFVEVARLVRERDEKNERIQPAYLVARKPAQ